MVDITKPRKLNEYELKQLKWFKTLPKDIQYEVMFRGLLLTHPKDINARLNSV